MVDDVVTRERMILGVASQGPSKHIKRLALVVEDSRASHAVAALRGMIETFVVETLSEVRAALTQQFVRQHESDQNPGKDGDLGFVGIDITRLPLADTELFASALRSTYQVGVVYVMTRAQLNTFEQGTFDFVVG